MVMGANAQMRKEKNDWTSMSQIRRQTIAGLTPGAVFTVTRSFSEADVRLFADMTLDYNPVHFDDQFVAAKGFSARICHGLLIGGMVTQIGGQIGWLASGMSFRFKRPVYIGDEVICTLTITDIDDRGRAKADAVIVNQHNDVVLTAHLTGIIPGKAEVRILEKIMKSEETDADASPVELK